METVGLDLAVMAFENIDGVERAYSRMPTGGIAWARETAFAAHHRDRRIVFRGTFAGRYEDGNGEQELIGTRAAEGGLGGSVAEERSGLHDVNWVVSSLEGHGGRLVRHRLTCDVASALQAAVADSPSAVPPPSS